MTSFIFISYRMYLTDFYTNLYAMTEFSLMEVIRMIFPYSMVNSIAFAALLFFVMRNADDLSDYTFGERCLCGIFSFFFLAGCVCASTGAFAEKMYSMRMVLFYLIFLVGTYYAFRFLAIYLRELVFWVKKSEKHYVFSEKKQFIITSLIFAICWLPYVILRYPAGVEYDAYFQIADFLDGTMTARWPPASSALMGSFVLLGQRAFGSTNLGIFIYCVVQTIVGSLIFSYCALVMRRLNVSALYLRISVAVFALIPVYPGYITSVVKDAPFALAVVLFTTIMADMMLQKTSIFKCIALAVAGILVCILRNNGLFLLIGIVLAILIMSLVGKRLIEKEVLIALVVASAMSVFYFSILLPAWGIKSTSEAEALSIPFQQTARLANSFPEEISEEEAEIIGRVLDIDVIAESYDPGLSDHVKGTYHGKGMADLKEYFIAWFKQGLRRPDVYIDAFLNNAIGFIYPDIRMANSPVVSGMYGQILMGRSVEFSVPGSMYHFRDDIKDFVSAVENLPVVFPFVNTALQLWLPIILLFIGIKQRNEKALLLLVPSLVGVLVCLASPTYMNNGARYAIPIVYTNMFLMGINLMREKRR